MGSYGWYRQESSVDKKEKNQKFLEGLRKTDTDMSPIIINGNEIASKWWGKAWVQGSSFKSYYITISIDKLDKNDWEKVKELCNRKIDTLETLLLGSFPKEFDEMFGDSKNGIFPSPKEIHFKCTCPDSAKMCKHIAQYYMELAQN